MRFFQYHLANLAFCGALMVGLMACSTSGHADEPIGHEPEYSRVVAMGDVHGDFKQMVAALRMAGLIDTKNRWIGGNAHFVQLGDLPDRGPDTRKVMDLLIELQAEASEFGGAVTVLIGNHDAMMMIGDLRYVHPGEYAAFKTRQSKALRKAYYEQSIAHMRANLKAEELPEFDKAYKKAWEQRFPLGYVEHRQAWAPTGEYGKWVLSRPAVAKIGDTLFVHGGISPNYAQMSITEMNTRVRTALAEGTNIKADTIVEDQDGPLWDRGWIRRSQNLDNTAQLNQVLAEYGVKRMVVAHTPLTPIIVPRFGGKVIMADVGLSAHYGGNIALVEIKDDLVTMIIDKQRLIVPNSEGGFDDYFDAAEKLVANPEKITRYREIMKQTKIEAKAANQSSINTATEKQVEGSQ